MSALAAPAFAALLAQCAPDAPADYMQRIVAHESGFRPYAIHDNTSGASFFPETYQEAVAKTIALIDADHSIDVGLSQINRSNWRWLGLTIKTVLDPCQNLQAGARVFETMSRYNTGDPRRGFANGYVRQVLARAPTQSAMARVPPAEVAAPPPSTPACAPAWDPWALASCSSRKPRTTIAAQPQQSNTETASR